MKNKKGDTIYRQDAIDAMEGLPKYFDKTDTLCLDYADVLAVLAEHLSSAQTDLPIKEKCAYCPHCENCDVNDDLSIAQPIYTDAEIQKMQDLESAQIEKAYQLGYEDGKKDAQPDFDINQKINKAYDDGYDHGYLQCKADQEPIYKRVYADGYHKAEKDYFNRTEKDCDDAFKAGVEIGRTNQERTIGHWIERQKKGSCRWQSWCSVCGKHSGIGGIESNRHKPFCPNCGSRMSDEVEWEI